MSLNLHFSEHVYSTLNIKKNYCSLLASKTMRNELWRQGNYNIERWQNQLAVDCLCYVRNYHQPWQYLTLKFCFPYFVFLRGSKFLLNQKTECESDTDIHGEICEILKPSAVGSQQINKTPVITGHVASKLYSRLVIKFPINTKHEP